ncbi:hypothetical protein VB638_05405 [Dolichospermum sp. UHCC 0684]|uniref:hypothetical protein n=1 Tax=unclassified Dolichospermum TaxID=2622029 RepID=UPI001445BAE2|nr:MULTISPECIES: hypothetical protein [unclassified Dolichospermum]MEA5529031.1 hypothetical protein [Dolichospermum sp. UHCC 0684]MTJ34016.1 hypothetical protein [Dolichospermum sp. UHCC 0260]
MAFNIPAQFVPGDSSTWFDQPFDGIDPTTGLRVTFSPADYELKYAIRGDVAIDLVASEQDGLWKTSLSGAVSLGTLPGTYFWQAYVTNQTGDRSTVGQGQLLVVAGLAGVLLDFDGRSESRKMLDAVTQAIQARLNGGAVLKYQIKDRDLERDPLDSLYVLRDKLKWEVYREERKGSSMNYLRFR